MPQPRRRPMVWVRRAVLVVVPAAFAFAAACGADGPARPADPVLAKGQDVYKQRCASCHGQKGEGVSGPKLGGGVVAGRYPDLAAQEKVVRDGITDKGMPAFGEKISAEEILAVSRYEREVLPG